MALPVEAVTQQTKKQPLLSRLILLFLVATIPAWFKFKLPKYTNGEKNNGIEGFNVN
jgi:hypothetical protein